ncbi:MULTISPECIES: DUF3025 domain-containing protein [unclassified Psychrobacter]|uniref:DUF3025 domain-containing protein n=1 Tax=unclassified Psychrobacter TaxID=196806 RepID=UPI0018F4143E|nr:MULTISPECIES: DUF3025 domain-containing protein [unclassified Psychrobacter]
MLPPVVPKALLVLDGDFAGVVLLRAQFATAIFIYSRAIEKLVMNDVAKPAVVPLDPIFTQIDWSAPWLQHLCAREILANGVQTYTTTEAADAPPAIIASILNQARTLSETALITQPTAGESAHKIEFVAQDALLEGMAYETFIAKTGNIPTRDNLHDLFNGSIWLSFPKTKALLNHHHMRHMAASVDIAKTGRGRVRDTITVFDENGAILVTCRPKIGQALKGFDWQACLVAPRALWDDISAPRADASAAVYVFGHALLEQLIAPRKPLCAHSVIINVTPDFFALSLAARMQVLDDKLAAYMDELLSDADVKPCDLSPLPILGVPHYAADNRDPAFYEDSFVFRSGRRKKQ